MKTHIYAAAAIAALMLGAAPAMAAPPTDFSNPVDSVPDQVTQLDAFAYGVIKKECQFKTTNPVYSKFDITQNQNTAVNAFKYQVKCNDRDTVKISLQAVNGQFTNQDVSANTAGRTVDYALTTTLVRTSTIETGNTVFFTDKNFTSGETFTSAAINVAQALGRGKAVVQGNFKIIGDTEGGAWRAGRYTEQFKLTIG